MKTTIIIICALLFLGFYIPYWRYQRFLTRFRYGLKYGSRVKYMRKKTARRGHITRVFNGGIFGVKDETTSKKFVIARADIYPLIGGKKGGAAIRA